MKTTAWAACNKIVAIIFILNYLLVVAGLHSPIKCTMILGRVGIGCNGNQFILQARFAFTVKS